MSDAGPGRTAPEIILRRRRTVFENSKFQVHSDHIADADGREIPDYLVVAPRVVSGDLVTGVTILPVWNDRIVFLEIYRHAVGRAGLEAPRGFIDPSETPAGAALRELTEETGLVCAPDRLVALGICTPEASTIAARVALFAALDCSPAGTTLPDEIGMGHCVTFSIDEAQALMKNMALEDVTSALALHRYFQMRNSPDAGVLAR